MKILIVTETLHSGGAETFVVRLANALGRDHEVVLVNIYPGLSKKELIDQLDKRVHLINLNIPLLPIKQKADGLLLRLNLDYSLTERTILASLKSIIRTHKPDVVHSHLFKVDYYITLCRAAHRFNHVSTNHGDYLLFDKLPPKRIIHYLRKRDRTVRALNHMVNISDEQMHWFHVVQQTLGSSIRLHKILNGYESGAVPTIRKSDLGLPEDSFVYGMVARGIREKGWSFLITSFLKTGRPGIYLLLVGEGPEIDLLKDQYRDQSNILFIGYAKMPVSYIRLFDIGLLTSVYKAESLPTVIIEYLYCNKPVIATDIGEIRKMMLAEDGVHAAGTSIPVHEDVPDMDLLTQSLQLYFDDQAYRETVINYTSSAFQKFKMQSCINEYLAVYR